MFYYRNKEKRWKIKKPFINAVFLFENKKRKNRLLQLYADHVCLPPN